MIIDPPTPFSPLAEWKEFLAEMERVVPSPFDKYAADDIARHIKLAKETIAEIQSNPERFGSAGG